MSQEFTDEELSGPVIDRRTTLKLLGGAGGAGLLAGCTGGGGGDGGGEGGGAETTKPGTAGQETTKTPNTPPQEKVGGTMNAGWFVGEITNLDPVMNSVVAMEQASMNIFNALLRTTPQFEIRGDAAKDWTVENKKTYVFQLREGMTFHDDYGEVTAEDVKYTIHRGKTAKGSTVKPKLKRIKPVDEGGVEVRDKYTVAINLDEPFVPMLKALTRSGGAAQIQSKEAVQDLGSSYKVEPIGSGPFAVKSHKVGSQLILSAHDDYWRTDANGVQLPYLDEVRIQPIPEAATMVNALRAGDISFANTIATQNLNTVEQSQNVKAVRAPAAGWIGLIFNFDREPFGKPKVRRAIAKLIDSKRFVKRVSFGNNMPAIGPIGPAHGPFYREDKPNYQKYDPDEAERLLEEAGAKNASWSILINQRDVRQARVMKQMLGDHFDVSINTVGTSTFWERFLSKRDFDAAITGSDIDISVDTTLYNFFVAPDKGGVYNQSGYSDPKVTELLKKQRTTFDQQKRARLIKKAEDRIMHDAPVAFTFHTIPWQVQRKVVNNYTAHPFMRDLAPVWLKG